MEFLLSYQSTIASQILIIEFIFECFESLTFLSIYVLTRNLQIQKSSVIMSHSLASAQPAGFSGKGRLRSTFYIYNLIGLFSIKYCLMSA